MFVFREYEDKPYDCLIIECYVPGHNLIARSSISMQMLQQYPGEARESAKRDLVRKLADMILDQQLEKEVKEGKQYNTGGVISKSEGKHQYIAMDFAGSKYGKVADQEELIKYYKQVWLGDLPEIIVEKNEYFTNAEAKNSYHGGGIVGPTNNQEAEVLAELTKHFGDCLHAVVKYPCGCANKETAHSLKTVIMHLNDHCGWTREEIADWLETLDIDLALKEE